MLLVSSKLIRLVCGVLETANFLLLKLLLKRPSAARSFPGKVFRDYASLVELDKWRSSTVFELFPDLTGVRITIEHLQGGGVRTPLDELAYLALVTRAVMPRRVFEIGTFRGRTALNFALNAPPECIVSTLDLPPSERDTMLTAINPADAAIIARSDTGADYLGKDVATKIKQLYGNSLTFDFSPYYGTIDIVFVDGAHHYEAALSDTMNALKMVREGGIIIWHDFANYGDYNDVTRAVLRSVPREEVIQIENTQLALYRKRATSR